ncbi:MAG: hypothetical protein HN919_07895 [Verrucomicrobia bacterium]|nr:hypothetical protein [Verrucomicrobiota bacterium]MBT7066207.1 hypothetical protein [Verrucomicrobiota bacterium]MBT7699306.1 hypothetical protein [Verrucomicrobiota bacterium]
MSLPDPRHTAVAGAGLAALLILGSISPVTAGRISIRTDAVSVLRAGALTLDVTLLNRGNTAAYDVEVTANLDGRQAAAEPVPLLKRGATQTVTIRMDDAPVRPGEQTVLLNTRYRDRHGYRFSTLSTTPLATAIPPRGPPPPELKLSRASLTDRADLVLSVNNPAGVARSVCLRLVLPDGIRIIEGPDPERVLAPHEQSTATWTVARTAGLPGSRYAVYALLEYMEGGLLRSRIARGRLRIPYAPDLIKRLSRFAPWLIGALAILALAGPRIGRHPPAWLARVQPITNCAALGLGLLYLFYHLPLHLLLTDSLIIGGDTPAHNVLASHIKTQLFNHGRLLGWSQAWWCGFPGFQFYFTLPYAVIALLSTLIPFNIAFKLISALGIFGLPLAAWGGARLARLPRPIASLLGVAMIALLFDRAHVMWGVNIYSTFAGMIANSISFPLMLLMLASALRDSDEGVVRLRTVLLMTLMIGSHFFTSIVGALCLVVMPICRPRCGFRRALTVLAIEGGLALLLMSWWIVPLLVRRSYAVDFGTNWPLTLTETVPPFLWCFAAMAALTTAWMVLRQRHWPTALLRFGMVALWMTCVAGALFLWGDHLSPVFVNVRLWPFLVYGITTLAMIGLGKAIGHARWPTPLLIAAALALLAWGPQRPNPVRRWAHWNYGGLEPLPRAHVVHTLADALRDTPGRLANDLHPDNEALGSSRIFEAMPHLAGKPVLEGGLVNSAWGALFSYYIQGETSDATAGFPTMVSPTAFNITNATQHLTLMNVKHFAARSERTRSALHEAPQWNTLLEVEGWELFENRAHDGRYVTVAQHDPIAVQTGQRQAAGLEWLYRINAIGQPFILLPPGEAPPAACDRVLSHQEFLVEIDSLTHTPAPVRELYTSSPISEELISDDTIHFRTSAIGRPHLVKCTYYPRWKATGADSVYMVTPGFMLVYPTQTEVTLRFRNTATEHIAHLLTVLGLLGCIGTAFLRRPHPPHPPMEVHH